jgi:glycosyltransferase involved in cell wall biosynthesis
MARILQLHAHYRIPGGEDAVAAAEAELLAAAGHEVFPLRRSNAGNPILAASQMAGYIWNPLSTHAVVAAARKANAEVAHVHNTWFAISPAVLRSLKRRGLSTVVTLHNYRLACANAQLLRDGSPCELCIHGSVWKGVRFRCYHRSTTLSLAASAGIQAHRWLNTWRSVDQFVALTKFSRNRLIAAGLPPDRITVHGNFVSDPGPRSHSPSNSRQVLFIGRLSPEKGLDSALRAWTSASTGDLELVVVGDDAQRPVLEAAADDSVTFLGWQPPSQVRSLLKDCRALLVPSRWYEGQPLVVLEAYAAGVPVIASAIGGLAETTAPLGTQWSVPPEDLSAWTEMLSNLTNDSLVEEGGMAARRLYEESYTPQSALERLETLYDRLLRVKGRNGRPTRNG